MEAFHLFYHFITKTMVNYDKEIRTMVTVIMMMVKESSTEQ